MDCQNCSNMENALCLSCFLKDLNDKKMSLVVGNGLLLSCPNEKLAFLGKPVWRSTLEGLSGELNKFLEPIKKSPKLDNIRKIELIFELLRLFLLRDLAQHYLPKQISSSDFMKKNKIADNLIKEFLTKFTKIFTINFDTITYWIRQEASSVKAQEFSKDGLKGPDPVGIDEIREKMEKNENLIPFYSLHGAFHLRKENKGYSKIDTSTDNHENFIKDFEECINTLSEAIIEGESDNKKRPLVILGENPYVKLSQIKMDPYLEFCYEELKKAPGDILFYGCSFYKCQHLLKAVFFKPNGQRRKIYITYVHDDTRPKELVIEYLEKNKWPQENIVWIEIPEAQKHLIWE